MTFKSSATSHVGMVRKLNEDSYAERSDIGVWVVADGMGGHEAGEVASTTVTDHIKALAQLGDFAETVSAVEESIQAANRMLIEQAATYDSQRVPGSTVVVLIIDGNQGALLWAGDSRIYRRREENVERVTRDHSRVQDLVEQGVIRESETESHPVANVITRAVGISNPLELETKFIEIEPEDQFLLCSDGLSRLVSDDEIQSMMVNTDTEVVVQSLLHTALVRGAPDNVTLICVKSCLNEETSAEDDESTVSHNASSPDDFGFDSDQATSLRDIPVDEMP